MDTEENEISHGTVLNTSHSEKSTLHNNTFECESSSSQPESSETNDLSGPEPVISALTNPIHLLTNDNSTHCSISNESAFPLINDNDESLYPSSNNDTNSHLANGNTPHFSTKQISEENDKSSSPIAVDSEHSRSNIDEATVDNGSLLTEEPFTAFEEPEKNGMICDLNDSEIQVDDDRPFTCHLCFKKFRNRAHIIYHLRYHPTANEKEIYKCEHCDKVYKYKRNYELHVKVHSFPYVCVRCSKGYNWKHHLVAHIKRNHSGSTRRIRCSMCPEVFGQKFAYMQHAKIHNDSDDVSEYPCDKCSKVFRYKALLLDHCKLHEQNKIYSCDQCPRTCLSALSLERHKTVHTGLKEFNCEKCDKSFTSSSSYQRHWKIHLGVKYKCEICLKTFTQKTSLMTHKGLMHNDDRPFCCEYCYKAFASNSKLVLHLKSHNFNKSYECENCSRAFSTYYSLLLHRKIHVKNNKYTNEYILREYNRSKILNGMPFNLREYHRFMWGTYEDLGMEGYEESNKLEQPMNSENSWVLKMDLEKVHNDPKTRITFVCPMCEHSFKGKSDFIYHVRSHPEVIPLHYPTTTEVCIVRPIETITHREDPISLNTVKPSVAAKQRDLTTDTQHFLGDHFLSSPLSYSSHPGPPATPQVPQTVAKQLTKPGKVYPTPMLLKEEIKEEVIDHSYGD